MVLGADFVTSFPPVKSRRWKVLGVVFLGHSLYSTAIGPLRRRIPRLGRSIDQLETLGHGQDAPLLNRRFWQRLSKVAFIAPAITLVVCVFRQRRSGDIVYWTVAAFVFTSAAFNGLAWTVALTKAWLRRSSWR